MSQLNIVAIFTIKSEYHAEFLPEFEKLVKASRQEKGCIKYDLNQDIKDPDTYIFVESWESQQAITVHNTQEHYKKFAKFCEGKVAKKAVHIMTQTF